ncbi:Rieske 2Fe-2S domain-containing protein [Streptomyces sp. NPDC051677]|uniref:Rieske 2Fe-2S domain-containing protein n=1 Tax=Streptomyces sp. NPDC051677 TaxID=3365669 RepID=UPI0037CEE0DA
MRNFVKQVEDLEALDGACATVAGRVARVTGSRAVKNALSGSWLGHPLHPALSDVPIGAWGIASLMDMVAGAHGARAARGLVGLGLAAAVPTAAAGASDWSDTYGAAQRVGLVHGACNGTATVLQAASWLARRRGRRGAGAMLSGMGLGLTLSAAYLGGHLTYVRGVGVNHTAFQETVTAWTDVAAESDLADELPLRVTADGVPVVLVRHDGRLYALSATCTHAGGPLDEGGLDDGCLRCPWHGSTFRLADGEVVRGPASVAQPLWDVKVEDGRVHVRSRTAG